MLLAMFYAPFSIAVIRASSAAFASFAESSWAMFKFMVFLSG
jgi:hypothetical protein